MFRNVGISIKFIRIEYFSPSLNIQNNTNNEKISKDIKDI